MAKTTSVRIKGEALRDLRERRGLSVADLARRCGSGRHPQSIRRLETAVPPREEPKRASRVFAHQIASALGVDISEFTIPADASPAQAVPRDQASGAAA